MSTGEIVAALLGGIIAGLMTCLAMDSGMRKDCTDYGKTRDMGGVVYECKRVAK